MFTKDSAVAADSILPHREKLSTSRRRLFTMALRLFGERGYHAVSVRDITDTLDQQPGAIYAHVSSKQQLLFELVRIGLEEHRDRLREIVLASGDDPEQQIRALVRAHVLVNLEYPELARVIAQEIRSLDDAQKEHALVIRGETERILADLIERGQRLGVFVPTDPFLTGTAIGAMGVRAAEWWSPAASPAREVVAETYAEFACRLLGVQPRPVVPSAR
jgi:AcrR family transcriptional regulator